MGLLGNIGKAFATGGLSLIGDTLGNSVGKLMNDATGVTSSAKQAQKYTEQNMTTSQGMTLEQMQKSHEYYMQQLAQNYAYEVNSAKNAIQWQMQDLKNAHLNPILAAGYGGANLGGAVGASGVSGGASAPSGATGTSGANPLSIIQTIADAKNTLANAKLAETKELGVAKENGWIDPKTEQEIKESKSRITGNKANTAKSFAQATAIKGSKDYMLAKAMQNGVKGAENANNPVLKELFNFLGGGK